MLVCLVTCLIVFLVTFVVPNFAELYSSMQAQLPMPTLILIAIGTTARSYVLLGVRRAGRGGDRVPLLGANAHRASEDDRPRPAESPDRWAKCG